MCIGDKRLLSRSCESKSSVWKSIKLYESLSYYDLTSLYGLSIIFIVFVRAQFESSNQVKVI
jgi:hypothetical protein